MKFSREIDEHFMLVYIYTYIYIYIYIEREREIEIHIEIYIYSPTPVELSSPANEVIVLPLAFIASLFIYELRSR